MSAHPEIKHTLVSVIIPAYNAASYIAQAVQSVIDQDYPSWELIIIDDGSKDNTAAVVAPFLSDARITYIPIENGGVSNARNYGAQLAKGDYFCFLDADDFFHPTNLSEKAANLSQDADAGLVHADVDITDEKGISLGTIDAGLSGHNLHLDILLWNGCVIPAPSSIMVRKEVFDAVGQWDPAFSTAADQDLFIRIASKYKVNRIAHTLTSYRIVNASMSRNATVFEKDHQGVYNKAKKNGLFPNHRFKRKCFANLYLIIAGTWWIQGHKARSIKYMAMALMQNPLSSIELVKKLRR